MHEYWIIDPAEQEVEKYRRQGNLLARVGVFGERTAFDGLPGVVVDLNAVWNPPWLRRE